MRRMWWTTSLVALLVGCAGDKGSSEGTADPDADGDGVPASEDCDDTDAAVYPGAPEACDGKDNDCDGAVDLADADVVGVETGPIDSDGDGYGDPGRSADYCAGDPPANIADNADDCDDRDDAINPAGNEICDGEDNDCDGLIDGDDTDAIAIPTWSQDLDGDGYGDAEAGFRSCSSPGEGYVENALDCDDRDAAIHPDAVESCGDGIDADCDGSDGLGRFAGDGELSCAQRLIDGPTTALASGDLQGDGTATLVIGGGAGVSVWSAPMSGAGSEATLTGDTVGALAIGDVDGDGQDDLVVAGAGAAPELWLASGPIPGAPALGAHASLGSGASVAAVWAGELDADEAGAELLVGRPGDTAGTSSVALVVDRVARPALESHSLAGLGAAIAAVGDLDGDGVDELAIGAPGDDSVVVVSVVDDGELDGGRTLTESGGFGAALAPVADVDGDGLADLVVGAPRHGDGRGAVFVVLADGTVHARMDGPAGGAAGTALARIGDLNQDGSEDLVVGTPGAAGGRADVVIGPLPSGTEGTLELVAYQLTADEPTARAGETVLGDVDLNGDGYHDFVVSLPGTEQTALFLGVRNW